MILIKILYSLYLKLIQMKVRLYILFVSILLSYAVLIPIDSVDAQYTDEIYFSEEELTIGYSVAIAVVVGIFVYLARDTILRRKTDYDKGDFESKKDKDFEKYHSDWLDDTVEFNHSTKKLNAEEFRKAAEESSLPNYYDILGVKPDAKHDEIRKRFRILAKKWHPDKKHDEDAEQKMSEINEAYEVLSDKEKRKSYDQYFVK